MSATSTSPTPAPVLSNGASLEYKAFARSFFQGSEGAVLLLVASCYFPSAGFQIFFQEDAGTFKLMQQNPTGIEPQIVTYTFASWPASSPGLSQQPSHVTIEDAHGQHKVRVEHWK
jgi:hypothetical protein